MALPIPNEQVSRYKHSGFFVLRTPLLPFDDLVNLAGTVSISSLVSANSHDERLGSTLEAEIDLLRNRMRLLVERPSILHALSIASPSLVSSIEYWLVEPNSKKGMQAERSLIRYIYRMAGRPTPFGLFSGCSVGTLGSYSGLVLAPIDAYRPSSRIDFNHLQILTQRLQRELRLQLLYSPNSTLNKTGDVFHYLRTDGSLPHAVYTLIRLYDDRYLSCTLRCSEHGATLQQLTTNLLEFEDLSSTSLEEIASYLDTLVNDQVLVTRVAPQATGKSSLSTVLDTLRSTVDGERYVNEIITVENELRKLDECGVGVDPATHRAISETINALSGDPAATNSIQTDLFKPLLKSSLEEHVAESLLTAIEFLSSLGVGAADPRRKLQIFRRSFRERYGSSWIQLEQALNEDFGIDIDKQSSGGTSPLVSAISRRRNSDGPPPEMSGLYLLLLQKLTEYLSARSSEMVLDYEDFIGLHTTPTQMPDAFSLTGIVIGSPTTSNTEMRRRVVLRAGVGPSGVTTMGRFAHLDDKLSSWIKEHIRDEESHNPDAIFAEIAYLPPGRAGNVVFRPLVRQYEIPYLGFSGAPKADQICVSDLLVTVAENDDIILYSKRLEKRVFPRLSCAHTFNKVQLPIMYRFLCYLQYEPLRTVPVFEWGPLSKLSFLPRVRFRNVILSLATWQLSTQEVETVCRDTERLASLMQFQNLRKKLSLPRWVSLVQGDNLLPVDLENPLSVDSMVQIIKRSGKAVLEEIYPCFDEFCVSSKEGSFQHEVVIPYVRRRDSTSFRGSIPEHLQATIPKENATGTPARTFVPGTEWTYFKVYCSRTAADQILTETMQTIVSALKSKHSIQEWFFIRYSDPHEHLRIRFRTIDATGRTAVQECLEAAFRTLVSQGRIWKIEISTYERELERYGGLLGMEMSEQIFSADSNAVLSLLRITSSNIDTNARWKIGVVAMDVFFDDAGMDRVGRLGLCKRMSTSLERELFSDDSVRRDISSKCREHRTFLEGIIDLRRIEFIGSEAMAVLESRSREIQPIVTSILELANTGSLTATMESLVSSFIHMFLNRLFAEEQVLHEYILYSMLARTYEGLIAKQHVTSRQVF